MNIDLILPVSVTMGLLGYGMIARFYIMPRIAVLPRTDSLTALLFIHCFRYVGMAFLIARALPHKWGVRGYLFHPCRHSPCFTGYPLSDFCGASPAFRVLRFGIKIRNFERMFQNAAEDRNAGNVGTYSSGLF